MIIAVMKLKVELSFVPGFSGLALRDRSRASRALVYRAGPANPPVLQAAD